MTNRYLEKIALSPKVSLGAGAALGGVVGGIVGNMSYANNEDKSKLGNIASRATKIVGGALGGATLGAGISLVGHAHINPKDLTRTGYYDRFSEGRSSASNAYGYGKPLSSTGSGPTKPKKTAKVPPKKYYDKTSDWDNGEKPDGEKSASLNKYIEKIASMHDPLGTSIQL